MEGSKLIKKQIELLAGWNEKSAYNEIEQVRVNIETILHSLRILENYDLSTFDEIMSLDLSEKQTDLSKFNTHELVDELITRDGVKVEKFFSTLKNSVVILTISI